MSEAPERIRVWPDYDDHFSPARHDWTGGIWDDTDDASGIEYIRADLSQAAVEALEAKLAKAVGALDDLISTYVWVREDEYERGWSEMSNAVHEATFVQMELKGAENE